MKIHIKKGEVALKIMLEKGKYPLQLWLMFHPFKWHVKRFRAFDGYVRCLGVFSYAVFKGVRG